MARLASKLLLPSPDDAAFYAAASAGMPSPCMGPVTIDSSGNIVVGYTTGTNKLLKFGPTGTPNTTFRSNVGTYNVGKCWAQSDGKVIGDHNVGAVMRRYNADGTTDGAFTTHTFNTTLTLQACAFQTDAKMVLGGSFTAMDGNTRARMVRLNANGTEDTAFYTNLGAAFNALVQSIALQSDGKILAGGNFTTFNGNTRGRLVRLNANGTEDGTFATNLGTGFNAQVQGIAVQSDGKILVIGAFTTFNGNARAGIVRLNANGTDDTAFYANIGTGFSAGGVLAVALQSTGKIILAGTFDVFNSLARESILRLNTDGTEDAAFYDSITPGIGPSSILTPLSQQCVAIQSDDAIVVTGQFTRVGGLERNYLVRIPADGGDNEALFPIPAGVTELMLTPVFDTGLGVPVGGPGVVPVVPHTNYILTINSPTFDLNNPNTFGSLYTWTGTRALLLEWVE